MMLWRRRSKVKTTKLGFLTAITATLIAGLALSSAPASAKTVKACQKEWQADKAAMQAAGKTEKAYVAACRGQSAAPAAAASSSKPPKEDKGGY
jgi:hypothetical protein